MGIYSQTNYKTSYTSNILLFESYNAQIKKYFKNCSNRYISYLNYYFNRNERGDLDGFRFIKRFS